MKKKIAKFEKISEWQMFKDVDKLKGCAPNLNDIKDLHDGLKLPQRATKGSAGYDFYLPHDIIIPPKSSLVIPTFIRCKIKNNYVLMLFPRSGQGFKYGIRLQNTCGIIDSDYYNSDNEGHIMVKLYNPNNDEFELEKGTAFCQGIFVPFGITIDDRVSKYRNGGFGSTDK